MGISHILIMTTASQSIYFNEIFNNHSFRFLPLFSFTFLRKQTKQVLLLRGSRAKSDRLESARVSEEEEEEEAMPRSRFAGSLSSPTVEVAIDTGNPLLNLTIDGFLKIGAVAATRSVAEDAYHIVKKGSVSKHNFEHTLKKMCKEGAYWGTVAGVYVGMEYGIERVRGTRDWKNAMIGGAVTGALVSAASNKSKDKVVIDAITGGAIATAAEFIGYLA